MQARMFLTYLTIGLVLSMPSPAAAQAPGGRPGPPLAGLKFLALLSAGDMVGQQNDVHEPLVFRDVPGMTATFDTSTTGCVTATFSAQVSSEFLLRVLLDGSPMDGHNVAGIFGLEAIEIRSPQTGTFSFSYTFWKCGVDTGPHEVRIQWATFPDNGTAQVWGRTLTVLGR